MSGSKWHRASASRATWASARVVHELAQHARAALGRLVEEDLPAVLPIGQRLGRQLAVLELVPHLDGVLQRGLQRGHDLRWAPRSPAGSISRQLRRSSTKGMTRAVRGPIGSSALPLLLGLLLPVAALHVEHEAGQAVGAPAPAQVDAPEGRRVAVGQA